MIEDFSVQLIYILLGLLFFKELIGKYLGKLLEKVFGVKVNGNGNGTPEWASDLKSHFNDDLSLTLKELKECTKKNSDILKQILEEERNEAEERRELQRTMNEMYRKLP